MEMVAESMEMAPESMEMAPGALPRPGRAMAAALEMFLWNMMGSLGFSRRGDYIGERAASVEARGGHTTWWRGRQVGRATLGCGRPLVRLRLSFGLRVRDEIIRSWVFVPSDSENISLSTFLKRKNSRKQELALGHLVNMVVPKMHKNAIRCKQNM